MKTATVRDLRYDFKKIENSLRDGDVIEITKRRKVIARLVPEKKAAVARPDFMAQLREIYGDQCLEVTGAEIIRMDRDRY